MKEFKIDAVILYADKKPRLRDKLQSHLTKGSTPLRSNRTRDNGELKFLLHSLKFLPWLNNTYLVVADKAPDYVNNTKIRVVRHRDFFSEGWRLPTYNSAQIQAQVHRIPDLEERFLLLDDDFLFLDEISPQFFFPSMNIVSVPRGKSTLSIDFDSPYDNTVSYLHNNCNNYLPQTAIPRQRFWHQAKPLIRSVCLDVYDLFFAEINLMKTSTTRNRFLDVLFHELLYYSLHENLIDSEYKVKFREVEECQASIAHLLDSEEQTRQSFQHALSNHPKFLCINDDMGKVANNRTLDAYREFMNTCLPEKDLYEN